MYSSSLLWQAFCDTDSVYYSTTVKQSEILPLLQPQQGIPILDSSVCFIAFAVNVTG